MKVNALKIKKINSAKGDTHSDNTEGIAICTISNPQYPNMFMYGIFFQGSNLLTFTLSNKVEVTEEIENFEIPESQIEYVKEIEKDFDELFSYIEILKTIETQVNT